MFRFDTLIEGKKVEVINIGTRVIGEKGIYEPVIRRTRSFRRNHVHYRFSNGRDSIYCEGTMLVKVNGCFIKVCRLKAYDEWDITPVSDSFLYIGLHTPSRSIKVNGVVFFYQ